MWFKNLNVYRLTGPWPYTRDQLAANLRPQAFVPCGQYDMTSMGWDVVREQDGELVHSIEGQFLLKLTIETKIMPASAIAIVVKARAVELEEQLGFKPGRKQMKELKEQVKDELLPRALVTRRHVHVWIDTKNGWLAVDTSSTARGDEVFKMLLKSLETLPVCAMRTLRSPMAAMTDWLAIDEAPANFSIDQEALLRGGSGKSEVKFTRQTLDAEDVNRHIASGKQCVQLAMTWNDRVSFVLNDALILKRIAPLDVLKESNAAVEAEVDRFNADFLLMSAECNGMLQDLVAALGGFDVKQEDLVERASNAADDLYQDAVKVVMEAGKASISAIQRHLQIGYNRAAKLLDQMELQGVVSPVNSSGQRVILKF